MCIIAKVKHKNNKDGLSRQRLEVVNNKSYILLFVIVNNRLGMYTKLTMGYNF